MTSPISVPGSEEQPEPMQIDPNAFMEVNIIIPDPESDDPDKGVGIIKVFWMTGLPLPRVGEGMHHPSLAQLDPSGEEQAGYHIAHACWVLRAGALPAYNIYLGFGERAMNCDCDCEEAGPGSSPIQVPGGFPN